MKNSSNGIYPVLLVDDERTILEAVYECGATAYMVKPIIYEELRRQLVQRLLLSPNSA